MQQKNETFNSYYEESRMDVGSFVFIVMLLQAADERGAEEEGRTLDAGAEGEPAKTTDCRRRRQRRAGRKALPRSRLPEGR